MPASTALTCADSRRWKAATEKRSALRDGIGGVEVELVDARDRVREGVDVVERD